mgnify:CR=1 FL=1
MKGIRIKSPVFFIPIVLALVTVGYGLMKQAQGDIQATASGPNSPAAQSPDSWSAPRTNSGGGVSVEARWRRVSDALEFEIRMNTHSVNLDVYDLAETSVIRIPGSTDKVMQEIKAISWEAPPGGHHVTGLLKFPGVDPSGNPIVGGNGRLVLVIRGLAGIEERVMQW